MNLQDKILDLFRRNSADASFYDPKEAVIPLVRVRGLIHDRILSDKWEVVHIFKGMPEEVITTVDTKEAADHLVLHSPDPDAMLVRRVVRVLVDYED